MKSNEDEQPEEVTNTREHFAEAVMVSEYEFQREWRRLFDGNRVRKETVRKARKLVNQLPLESPLRVRFGKDLDEIEAAIDRDDK